VAIVSLKQQQWILATIVDVSDIPFVVLQLSQVPNPAVEQNTPAVSDLSLSIIYNKDSL